LTPGMALAPPVCPEIEDVMEVDISQQWQGNRPLGACLPPPTQALLLPSPQPSATCGQGGSYDGHRCGARQSASATRDCFSGNEFDRLTGLVATLKVPKPTN
jgi:hypothetical protein